MAFADKIRFAPEVDDDDDLNDSPPVKAAQGVPSDPPVGTREWAAALIQEFGKLIGTRFFDRQLSLSQARREARRQPEKQEPAKRQGLAGKLRLGRECGKYRRETAAT